jgi:8-oxo-dGTP pyrophosphatase MutT (NUDIX family)
MSQWKVLKSLELFKAGFFRLRTDECRLPDGRVMPRYYVIEMADWVNVVPVTADGQVLLLKQYRHGAGMDFLEIPGGSTHPGANEDPRVAAERELLEETGYQAAEWVSCGFHFPNPALQNNRMHTYLALGCVKVAEPSLDPFEDLENFTMDVKEMVKIWRDGAFAHSLISASIGLSIRELEKRGLI